MQFLGLPLGMFSVMGMFIAFLPLLGWMNWGVVPFALTGLVISIISITTARKSNRLCIAAIVLCCISILVGVFRLNLGGGFL
ncbi:hypothetical protein ACFLTP_08800 [Chloroflexota bacterium]